VRTLMICSFLVLSLFFCLPTEASDFWYKNTCSYFYFENGDSQSKEADRQKVLFEFDWGSLNEIKDNSVFFILDHELDRTRKMVQQELSAKGFSPVPYDRLQKIPQEYKPSYLIKLFYSVCEERFIIKAYRVECLGNKICLIRVKSKLIASVDRED